MPPRSPEPLRRITLNLFESDCVIMERRYGHGWSERVRELVRKDAKREGMDFDELNEIYERELEEDHG